VAADILKTMIGTKALKAGHFVVEFATPGIGHMLKNAGCDFVVFDMEHSAFGYETVKQAVRYAEAARLRPHRPRLRRRCGGHHAADGRQPGRGARHP
jgi:2-keto-3-deoxy-L-rhamnonate aldolase RhmA